MSAPQRKGCRGTLTRFRNPAAAPVLRWVIGEIRPARASSRIRQISCRSVEFCRVAAGCRAPNSFRAPDLCRAPPSQLGAGLSRNARI